MESNKEQQDMASQEPQKLQDESNLLQQNINELEKPRPIGIWKVFCAIVVLGIAIAALWIVYSKDRKNLELKYKIEQKNDKLDFKESEIGFIKAEVKQQGKMLDLKQKEIEEQAIQLESLKAETDALEKQLGIINAPSVEPGTSESPGASESPRTPEPSDNQKASEKQGSQELPAPGTQDVG